MIESLFLLTKDDFQIMAWIAAIFFGIISVKNTISQRRRELRWKQAKETIRMVESMWSNSYAKNGLLMISHCDHGKYFSYGDSHKIFVGADDIIEALNDEQITNEGTEFIGHCLEWVFDHMAKFYHCVRADLISTEYMRYHMGYYVAIMANYKEHFESYMLREDYEDGVRFLELFREWTNNRKESSLFRRICGSPLR